MDPYLVTSLGQIVRVFEISSNKLYFEQEFTRSVSDIKTSPNNDFLMVLISDDVKSELHAINL